MALDAGYINDDLFNELMLKAMEVGRIIGGLRSAVERKRGIG